MGKLFWYVTSHSGQLSLAIPLLLGARSTSKSWGVIRHIVRCTSAHICGLAYTVKLVSGWVLKKWWSVYLMAWERLSPHCGTGDETLNIYFSSVQHWQQNANGTLITRSTSQMCPRTVTVWWYSSSFWGICLPPLYRHRNNDWCCYTLPVELSLAW